MKNCGNTQNKYIYWTNCFSLSENILRVDNIFQVSKIGPPIRLSTREVEVSLILLLFSGKVLKVVNNDCRNMTYLFHVKVCLWQNSLNRLGMLVQYPSTIKLSFECVYYSQKCEPHSLKHLAIMQVLNFTQKYLLTVFWIVFC